MDSIKRRRLPERRDGRVIVHFDYDCFYAAVFEAENPALKSLPLAVQQKQIIVTCNYEARKRGLHKLQLITEAKRICPEVIIVLGEDISRFRDASKELYNFLAPFSWSRKVERLGFDEVWFDVTDVVDYNIPLLNRNNLAESFFQLAQDDPTLGFSFDATSYIGNTYPEESGAATLADQADAALSLRLKLGSHLAMHMRHELEHHRGYTATVGIATNKLLSKLVGNLKKPNGQTTLLPPLGDSDSGTGNAIAFLDSHDIGKVPNIGFKTAQKLRGHVLERPADFDIGLVYGGTKEHVSVRDVRLYPDLNAETLEQLLSGPGAPHGIGPKIWGLLHGVDDTEVAQARPVPRQISIEDSYIRLDTMAEVLKELTMLSKSLLARMRIDLLGDDLDDNDKRWLAHPKTLRLTTRPRQPLNADGSRTRSFKRISHSAPLPGFVFSLAESVEALAERLVHEALVGMFRRLHPERQGWNLSLVNVAVTNMVETGGETRTAVGRDIGNMFRRQEDVLKDFRVVEEVEDEEGDAEEGEEQENVVREDKGKGVVRADPAEDGAGWAHEEMSDDEAEDAVQSALDGQACGICGLRLPFFALAAHERFHQLGD
ncbi:DNA/RNA polymerase [Myriangium duriaei CBS 260.36]|uniref:DNA/RNA polymerase n=1 Tax=Myriangium duriaei CBS 260.36 TaxID=1168546 RepID=A0A9P4MIB2_9PEZI|nr:DNA/RNA polymerase [Myriangium duriaei CBS 260.36]